MYVEKAAWGYLNDPEKKKFSGTFFNVFLLDPAVVVNKENFKEVEVSTSFGQTMKEFEGDSPADLSRFDTRNIRDVVNNEMLSYL